MMAAYSQHQNQLQHPGMQQGPQQHVQGHPGQPAPHGMQQLHPQQAQVYAQQHQMALAGLHPGQAQMAQIQQQQQLLVQAQQRQRQQQAQQHAMMNGMGVGVGTPGMIFQGQNNGSPQVRGGLPNGLYTGGPPGGGVPGANMGGYGGGNPQMRGNVSLPPHIHQQLAQAAQQQQQQQQQQMAVQAQQLAMSQANATHSQASPMSMAPQPQMGMQNSLAQQQQALQVRAQQQAQQQPQSLRGASVLKLYQFCSHLAAFESRQQNDINHWRRFVHEFYSPGGVMRQALWNSATRETKQFEITTQVLARYYYTLFESGVKNVQILLENTRETVLPNQGHIVESPKASFIYWFQNGCHLIATGILKATFNPNSQMEALDFQTGEHVDYVPRSILNALVSSNEDAQIKLSPGSKSLGKRPLQQRSVDIPDTLVNSYGVPDTVFRCLEIAETISQMRDLFNFSQANVNLTPRQALQSIVQQQQQQQQQQHQHLAHQHAIQQQAIQQQHQQAAHASAMAQGLQPQQGHPGGPGGPVGMPHGPQQHPIMAGGLPIGLTRSPSANEIRMGVPPSPHLGVGGVGGPGTTPSPAQNHIQAPGLVQQHSQQGHPTSNPSSQTSTTVGSANTSPNQTNKRRRASTTSEVKQNDDSGDGSGVNGTANNKVKQSPRGVNKRVKTNS